jgi:hypothetical protein
VGAQGEGEGGDAAAWGLELKRFFAILNDWFVFNGHKEAQNAQDWFLCLLCLFVAIYDGFFGCFQTSKIARNQE